MSIVFNSAITHLNSPVIGSGGGGGGGATVNSTNDFRLTLSSGNPVYAPQPATPSSTDTVAFTVTFATAPGWTNATIATPSATGGGLTTGTIYYLHAVSSTVFSFHTTVADALAGTNKVTLNASITAEIRPSGVSNTTVYCSPYKGNALALFDGVSTWNERTSAEFSVALGTLTSGLPYDIFCFDNATVPTLDPPLAWTNGTTRATALSRQDGVWAKSTDTKRRYIGTIYTNSTTTTIDDAGHLSSQVGGKRFVWNVANRIRAKMDVADFTASWTYNAAVVRQANGAAGNKVEMVLGLSEDDITAEVIVAAQAVGGTATVSVGIDTTTAYRYDSLFGQNSVSNGDVNPQTSRWNGRLSPGYHFIAWLENSPSGSSLFVGYNGSGVSSQSGLVVLTSI